MLVPSTVAVQIMVKISSSSAKFTVYFEIPSTVDHENEGMSPGISSPTGELKVGD